MYIKKCGVKFGVVSVLVAILCVNSGCRGAELTPPYFNLATGRNITATATCGEDVNEPELYCKLTGVTADRDVNVIQGQACDVCDPSDPKKRHPAQFAIDGTELWWQSPPLSRGLKYNEVNLTIDFGQEYHVAFVYLTMGISPMPAVWILEKSVDYGKTFKAWQYFAESREDCERFFGEESTRPIMRDDSVICTNKYSQIVPLENGEIPIKLLEKRPSEKSYFNSSVLQEWTRATNVRLHFKRTKNLLAHLISVAEQKRPDPSVTRRYFYSIRDINIGGRCMCNGHASTCHPESPGSPRLVCDCQHHTCGEQCNTCCPGFEQKAWKQSTNFERFECEACNCFNHSLECRYDEEVDRQRLSLDIHGRYDGGGVCVNCRDNTEGINCNKCKATYFRPSGRQWNETNVCEPCACDLSFSTGNCREGDGKCECRREFRAPDCTSCNDGYFDYPNCKECGCYLNGTRDNTCEPHGPTDNPECGCKPNFSGKFCKQCASMYYDFPNCTQCDCNPKGSSSPACDVTTGQCKCLNNYAGRTCDMCEDGYYNYPECTFCKCDPRGTQPGICNKETGQCLCKEGFGGARCDQCQPRYYGFPDCKVCNCSAVGSASYNCDASGKCPCAANFAGKTCAGCSPGYYAYPECKACNCEQHGSIGVSCDDQGRCTCRDNFEGERCQHCKENFYNFPICEACNCNPAGLADTFLGCASVPAGELCQCKERVQGRTCNECKPLYWNLNNYNALGCQDCECNLSGTIGSLGICDGTTGQCFCKPSVESQTCNECRNGFYKLEHDNLFGCQDCNCDVGGALNNNCNKTTGKCQCHPRVNGTTCNQPIDMHYFPTLHQLQYELEDGHTPNSPKVRVHFDPRAFPDFSWKGYVTFSKVLQPEVIYDVRIDKPTVYRLVLRYVNPNDTPVTGVVTITPVDEQHDFDQKLTQSQKIAFNTTRDGPRFLTVTTFPSATPHAFVLNNGRWSVKFRVDADMFVDYFVLLPAAYYEASILTRTVDNPCVIDGASLCRHFSYPNTKAYDHVRGENGFTRDRQSPKEYVNNPKQVRELSESLDGSHVPLLNARQQELNFDLTVRNPGVYVILIKYVTPVDDPRTHAVTVNVQDDDSARVWLYACTYTWICQQAVNDRQQRVATFNFTTNYVNVAVIGDDLTNVGIVEVVAIPLDQWSLQFLQPKPVCVRKDGQCVKARYQVVPNVVHISFDDDPSVISPVNGTAFPANLDNSSKVISLDATNPIVEVRAKVSTPDYYVIIVHHYQPNDPEFHVDVTLNNGQRTDGKLRVAHCPEYSGCRGAIEQADGNITFALSGNFTVTITNPASDKAVWLDYILVVPHDVYDAKYLRHEKFDQTREFITTCGNNHFHMDPHTQGFCRESVFSLTTDYNNAALPCNCDFDGVTNLSCEPMGGQCPCKANVMGVRCDTCKPGHYDFPNCKPCNCPPSARCDPDGRCNCEDNVIGDMCDRCAPFTYGFDVSIGCEQCACSPLGVINNNLSCDVNNGTCPCKANIEGRTCDHCAAGFYSFPYCAECDCDERGTTENICDDSSAECLCKPNVAGQMCDVCVDGTFNLQEENPDGCLKCFCFGKATKCESSQLYRTTIGAMRDWTLITVRLMDDVVDVTSLDATPETLDNNAIGADLSGADDDADLVYFSAPTDYLGNKLTSYGGNLSYTVFYTSLANGASLGGADVILRGLDSYLFYKSSDDRVKSPNADLTETFAMLEENFYLANGRHASRENLMIVLETLTGLYIRATYSQASVTTRLHNVRLDGAIEEYTVGSAIASSVEVCQCPPGYSGLSCEDCASGYYRINGPNGGYCVECQCNGHSEMCDQNTGICLGCQHSTRGEHCEECLEGYHGVATTGTPMDCLICACPLPVESNNFATKCEVSSDGMRISCTCKPGYFGARCQSCSSGFYGNPELVGDVCKTCNCSGNIDTNEIGSCDTVTGECLKCLNNTSGPACNYCQPGYYGDAVLLKNCQTCICDKTGTRECNNHTGVCECHANVVGEKCDRCEVNHYGFNSGQGCLPCSCGDASVSDQCDDQTGQCKCQPGVTGRTCDRCQSGYWNYQSSGCVTCECNTNYSLGLGCNPETGACECLPGVIGDKCGQCPPRWVLIPNQGCFGCDSCVDDLLDVTDYLRAEINPVIVDFETVTSGYFTAQRLVYLNKSVGLLKPQVDRLDPNVINLKPILDKVDGIEQETRNLKRTMTYAEDTANQTEVKFGQLKAQEDRVTAAIDNSVNAVHNTIKDVQDIADRFESGNTVKLESAAKEANEILADMKLYDFGGNEAQAITQLQQTEELTERIERFVIDAQRQTDDFYAIDADLMDADSRLNDLQLKSILILRNVSNVEDINNANKGVLVLEKIGGAEMKNNDIEAKLNRSNTLLKNATNLHKTTEAAYDRLAREQLELHRLYNELNDTFNRDSQDLDDARDLLEQALIKVRDLTYQAENFDDMLTSTRNTSEDAVEAANAYTNIFEALNNSANAITQATDDIQVALGKLLEPEKLSIASVDELLNEADKMLRTAHETSPFLATADRIRVDLARTVGENTNQVKRLNEELDRLEPILATVAPNVTEASERAARIKSTIVDTNEILGGVKPQLDEDNATSEELRKTFDQVYKNVSYVNDQCKWIDVDSKLASVALFETEDDIDKITRLLNGTSGGQPDTAGVDNMIDKLNHMVDEARDEVNRITVGVKFYRNTTLKLQNPPNLSTLGTSMKVSLYARTNQTDGFLLYLGNELSHDNSSKNRRTRSEDFMQIDVENGFPVLTIDLGSGPQRVISNKNISNGNWHQIIVERTGKNVKLIAREQPDEKDPHVNTYTTEDTLPGANSIFNVDQQQSSLFVGGYPNTFNGQLNDREASFDGEIETLEINGMAVSLWNFVDATDNEHGAKARDRLLDRKSPDGLRFGGKGYVTYSTQSLNSRQMTVFLDFKTKQPDGLLFLMGNEASFTSIELNGGRVLYQFKLPDAETVEIASSRGMNDNNWHKLEIGRQDNSGILRVDEEIFTGGVTLDTQSELTILDQMFFGGHPSGHNIPTVTNVNFDGCIREVQVEQTSVNLNSNLNSFDVKQGCPDKFSGIISFAKERPGYLHYVNVTHGDAFEITLAFRTIERNDALIFYATNSRHDETLSLSLINGDLILQSLNNSVKYKSSRFNDGEKNVVTAINDATKLQLLINDYENVKQHKTNGQTKNFAYKNIYFGGLPNNLIVPSASVPTRVPFAGCIEDVTLNGRIVNFANVDDQLEANLDTCNATTDGTIGVANIPPPVDIETDYNTVIPDVDTPVTQPLETTTKLTTPPLEYQTKSTTAAPASECVLPPEPVGDLSFDNSYRFGTSMDSHLEYDNLFKRTKNKFEFSLDFRTRESSGIILYAADANQMSFVALYLHNGRIVYKTNVGVEPSVVLTGSNFVNDDQWHNVIFDKRQSAISLIVDNEEVLTEALPSSKQLLFEPPFYLGGINNTDQSLSDNVRTNLDTTQQFLGCVRNFKSNGVAVSVPARRIIGVIPCSDHVEPGVFFGAQTGHIKVAHGFNVGLEIDIKFEIKPRNLTGFLIGVHGKRDYLVVHMENGIVKFTVDNGRGPFEASFAPNQPNYLCDGKWHTVQALKSRNVATLSVDTFFSDPKMGPPSDHVTTTKNGLFVGGHPYLQSLKGFTVRKPYNGCMKNLMLNSKPWDLSKLDAFGNITLNFCPTN